ncbi:MAG: hypothetical protein IJO26_04685 [Clostridium sp.]|nr:hypothetical protein [Clostridium sp.]
MEKTELSSYLEERGISILNSKILKDKNINELDIYKQIDNIMLFHEKIGQYKENLIPRIGSSIGKEVNNYYSYIFILSNYLNKLKLKENLNSIDFYLLDRGEVLVNLGKNSLNHIKINNYRDLIKRSMKNYEVCLTRVDEGNLNFDDNKIKIGSTRYLTYNLREHDIYSYIKRVKRREIKLNIENVIDYFINRSNLGSPSKEYLRALAAYPNEELRVISKYILRKITLSEEEIINNLYKAREIDNKGIII